MTALTDAIERLRADFVRDDDGKLIWDVTEDQALIYEVARRVADAPEWLQQLLENPESAEPVPWCDIHGGKFRFEDRCDGADVLNLDVCRMVRMLLVSPGIRPRGRHARQEDQWKD